MTWRSWSTLSFEQKLALRREEERRQEWLESLGGEERVAFYLRKGLNLGEALTAALAWERNMEEQSKRRDSHGCGYEGRNP